MGARTLGRSFDDDVKTGQEVSGTILSRVPSTTCVMTLLIAGGACTSRADHGVAARQPAVSTPSLPPATGWPTTLGDAGESRHSALSDINRKNVRDLRVAWTYRHGDVRQPSGPDKLFRGTSFEATPIIAEGHLVFSTPYNRVIALDPETGRELWTFDPRIDKGRRFANMMVSRGVAYWRGEGGGECAGRIFSAPSTHG